MKIRRIDSGRAAVAAVVVGALMVAFAGVKLLDGDDGPAAVSTSGQVDDDAFGPFDGSTRVGDLAGTDDPVLPGARSATGSAGADPFAIDSGDRTPHKVTIAVTSDGPFYVGYKFRNGKKGLKSADRSFSLSLTVRGQLPVAQVGVQVYPPGTNATCTVTVDGVKVNSGTAKETYGVAVCLG